MKLFLLCDWGKGTKSTFSMGSFWTHFHCILVSILVTFLIHVILSQIYWCQSCFVFSGLAYEVCSGDGPSTPKSQCVCLFDSSPMCKIVDCVFARYTYTVCILRSLHLQEWGQYCVQIVSIKSIGGICNTFQHIVDYLPNIFMKCVRYPILTSVVSCMNIFKSVI